MRDFTTHRDNTENIIEIDASALIGTVKDLVKDIFDDWIHNELLNDKMGYYMTDGTYNIYKGAIENIKKGLPDIDATIYAKTITFELIEKYLEREVK
jgi:hypothetical protein